MTRTLKLTPSESLTIKSSTPEALEVEATWGPEGDPPPKHLHPAQDERFEVLEGTLTARVGDEERELGPGVTLEIPRGTPHQMWNATAAPARATWRTSPRLRTEQWFESIDGLNRKQTEGGAPGPLDFAPYLNEFRDVFRLTSPPEVVQRPLFGLLAGVGRLRNR